MKRRRLSPALVLRLVRHPHDLLRRWLAPQAQLRSVTCLGCAHRHQAPALATASHCPACGAYVSLKDYVIEETWSRSIETRGNVRIRRGGSVTGVSIRCHHLEVDGKFVGSAECSGDFTIRSSARILGHVECQHLRIERRARVEFASTVHAHEVTIDGEIAGNLVCSGRLLLHKKALLTGDIQVGTLLIKDGARHHGSITMAASNHEPTQPAPADHPDAGNSQAG